MILRPSYLHNGISYTGKMVRSFILNRGTGYQLVFCKTSCKSQSHNLHQKLHLKNHKSFYLNAVFGLVVKDHELHQPWLWFITGGYLVKRWFLPAAARARGQSNDLNREILASNLFNCCKEVINAPPVPSISRCIHIVYRHKNVWEYQWSNFIYNCMSTFLHCKDALLDCSGRGGERCESLTRVDEIHDCQLHPAL